MPVKRRVAKHRFDDPAVELNAWWDLFETSFDFFGELDALGFKDEKAARAAAGEAWQRLGADFMATWTKDGQPWALTQFGEPKCR